MQLSKCLLFSEHTSPTTCFPDCHHSGQVPAAMTREKQLQPHCPLPAISFINVTANFRINSGFSSPQGAVFKQLISEGVSACFQSWGLKPGPCLSKCSVPQPQPLSSARALHHTHTPSWSFLVTSHLWRTGCALKTDHHNPFRM